MHERSKVKVAFSKKEKDKSVNNMIMRRQIYHQCSSVNDANIATVFLLRVSCLSYYSYCFCTIIVFISYVFDLEFFSITAIDSEL